MSYHHIITLAVPATLRMSGHRIDIHVLDRDQHTYFAPIDVAVVILDHPAITLSHSVMRALSENGAVIMATDDRHMPHSLTVPIGFNREGTQRGFEQLDSLFATWTTDQHPHPAWHQIIHAKIMGQASVIADRPNRHGAALYRLAEQALQQNPSEREAQAAALYWKDYFALTNTVLATDIHKREKQGAEDVVNSHLNYGYAIVRSMVARSLCGAGFYLGVGMGHNRRDNPFNLVEDFTEPFRWVVDRVTLHLIEQHDHSHAMTFDQAARRAVLHGITTTTVTMGDKTYRLFQAVDQTVYSFARVVSGQAKAMILPHQAKKRGRPAVHMAPDHHYIDSCPDESADHG